MVTIAQFLFTIPSQKWGKSHHTERGDLLGTGPLSLQIPPAGPKQEPVPLTAAESLFLKLYQIEQVFRISME